MSVLQVQGMVLSYRYKGRHVIAQRDMNMDRPIYPVRLVDLLQALSKGMCGYPDDGVGLRGEIVAPTHRFSRDQVFRDLVIQTLKMLLADKSEHSGQIAGSPQYPGGQQPAQLIFFSLKSIGIQRRHHTNLRFNRNSIILSRLRGTISPVVPSCGFVAFVSGSKPGTSPSWPLPGRGTMISPILTPFSGNNEACKSKHTFPVPDVG